MRRSRGFRKTSRRLGGLGPALGRSGARLSVTAVRDSLLHAEPAPPGRATRLQSALPLVRGDAVHWSRCGSIQRTRRNAIGCSRATSARSRSPACSTRRGPGVTSDEHCGVDGTLVDAWASQKNLRHKDGGATTITPTELAQCRAQLPR